MAFGHYKNEPLFLPTDSHQFIMGSSRSGKGVCLVTEGVVELGTPLAVEIWLPDREKPIAFLGDVVRSVPVGTPRPGAKTPTAETGIRFVSIDPKDRALIIQFARLNALPSL